MLNAPFRLYSAVIIPAVGPVGKCAILSLFLPVQTQNRGSDLPQGHLGNIAGGNTQDSKSFQGVEVVNTGKFLPGEILPWVQLEDFGRAGMVMVAVRPVVEPMKRIVRGRWNRVRASW